MDTGRQKLNADLIDSARGLAGPAADLASGAGLFRAATNAFKDAALDKLLGPTAVLAGGLVGILRTIKLIVDQSGILQRGLQQIATMQGITGQFETLLKSATLAKQRVRELYQFAANSPFKLADVAEANRLLQTLTHGALSSRQGMKLIGDAASATGQSMSAVAEQVGRAYNAISRGGPIDRIALRMQTAGLVTDEMAAKLERLEQVGAGFAEKWAVIDTALHRTDGGMQNDAKNLDTLSTRLENVSNEMERAFGRAFVDAKAKSIEVSIKATENITPLIEQIGQDIAPVLTFANQFKTSIAESTLATKGFAAALGAAWNAGKVLFGTAALSTLATLTRNAPPVVARTARFVGATVGDARTAILAAKGPGGTLAEASAKWSAAKAALAPDGAGLQIAASLAAQAAAAQIATRVMILHTTALNAVGTATGLVAVRNYAAAASTTVLAGAASVAGRAVRVFASAAWAATTALAKSPVTWLAAAAVGTFTLVRSINAAEAAYKALNDRIAETHRRLREGALSAGNEQAWAENVNAYTEALQKAQDELEAFQQKRREQFFSRRNDQATEDSLRFSVDTLRTGREAAIRNRVNVDVTDRERDRFRAELDTARDRSAQTFQQEFDRTDGETQNRLIAERIRLLGQEAEAGEKARKAREEFDRSAEGQRATRIDAQLADEIRNVDKAREQATQAGLTAEQIEGGNPAQLRADLVKRRAALKPTGSATEISTAILDGPVIDFDTSDKSANAAARLNAISRQIAAIDAYSAAVDRQKQKEAEAAQIRRNAGDELTRTLQQEADIRAELAANPAPVGMKDARVDRLRELQREEIRLQSAIQNADSNRREASDLTNRLRLNRETQQLKAAELDWEERISNARSAGLETANLEAQKAVDLARQRAELAKASGRPEEEREARTELRRIESEQADFRTNAAIDRERNARLLRGDGPGARSIDDALQLRRLIDQYKANGLSETQAKADFEQSLAVQNYGGPRVSVDPLQAIGGGGGSSLSNGVEYQRRTVTLTEQMLQQLTRIAEQQTTGEATIN